jgi:hypothetical protein
MNRVSIFCPNCKEYGQLQQLNHVYYRMLCCFSFLRDRNGEMIKNQEGLIKVLQGGSWRVGEKSFMTPKEYP